jgi:hypothetical protein
MVPPDPPRRSRSSRSIGLCCIAQVPLLLRDGEKRAGISTRGVHSRRLRERPVRFPVGRSRPVTNRGRRHDQCDHANGAPWAHILYFGDYGLSPLRNASKELIANRGILSIAQKRSLRPRERCFFHDTAFPFALETVAFLHSRRSHPELFISRSGVPQPARSDPRKIFLDGGDRLHYDRDNSTAATERSIERRIDHG